MLCFWEEVWQLALVELLLTNHSSLEQCFSCAIEGSVEESNESSRFWCEDLLLRLVDLAENLDALVQCFDVRHCVGVYFSVLSRGKLMLDYSAVNEEQLIYLRQNCLAHACERRSQSRAHFHASRELLSQWQALQAFPLALTAIFNTPGDHHHPMAQASDSGVNFKSTCGVSTNCRE